MAKVKAAIIGSGLIGSDLLMKSLRSEWLRPVMMIGVDPTSQGLARARECGLETFHEGVQPALDALSAADVKIAFDATSAKAHKQHCQALMSRGILMVDLTPAAVGPFCVPPVNLIEHQDFDQLNVNMISCGGQATIPMVAAVSAVQKVSYGEIVATVASRSIGPGTRQNIDEFTRTTALGIEKVGGADRGKAIIVINPAEPPILMRDTIHCLTVDPVQEQAVRASIGNMVAKVQEYVPGYRLICDPVIEGRRVSIHVQVEGLGDFLPKYAGNLDIMTAAALKTAELFGARMQGIGGLV